jgi:hypothetical protein
VTAATAPADDRAGLLALVSAYARCVDGRDYDGLARLFASGSRVGKFEGPRTEPGPGFWRAGGEPFAASVRVNHARYRVTTHHLGQHTAALDGDRAGGETYCLAHHVYPDGDRWMNRVMAIRYLDDYVRGPAGWLFAERRIFVDWIEFRPMGSVPTTAGWQPAGQAQVR